jgi:hypothetical protein
VSGKKTIPVVLVESTSGIIPERRLRASVPHAAWNEMAPSASIAAIEVGWSAGTSVPALQSFAPARLGDAARAEHGR